MCEMILKRAPRAREGEFRVIFGRNGHPQSAFFFFFFFSHARLFDSLSLSNTHKIISQRVAIQSRERRGEKKKKKNCSAVGRELIVAVDPVVACPVD